MNQATSHLTDSEIETCVSQDAAKNPDQQRLRLEAHLTDCESCLERVLHAERNRLGLLEGDRMKETPYPGCPPEETLQELAAGIAPPDTAEATTEHAAHCNFCGPRLSRYLREFSDPVEEEDAAILKQLETSKAKWQKKFVRENIAGAEARPKWSLFGGLWPKMAIAGAGVAIAAVMFIYLRPADELRQAQKLVASAYSERRTTEMRFPSAPFAAFSPVPVVKGPADGGDWKSAPAPLVEAEAIITKRSTTGDLNPQWLQVEGRIDLLQGNPKGIDLAIDAFEKALARDSQNLSLKVDLASAYFEKEMLADHERPVLIKTIDLLNDVIKNAKQDDTQLRAAALFNLAIAYEKSEMLDLAASTWTQYLGVDNTSGWAKEAQKHLDELKKNLNH